MKKNKKQQGFTLVEIAVAVAILGIGLVTLIGLNTRLLDTYYSEKNRIRAALYAQYLMTRIEILPDPPELGSNEQDLLSELEDAGYFDEDSFETPEESLKLWQVSTTVSPIDLPLGAEELAEDAMRQVIIKITWSDSEDDQFALTYLINNSQNTDSANTGTGTGFPAPQ